MATTTSAADVTHLYLGEVDTPPAGRNCVGGVEPDAHVRFAASCRLLMPVSGGSAVERRLREPGRDRTRRDGDSASCSGATVRSTTSSGLSRRGNAVLDRRRRGTRLARSAREFLGAAPKDRSHQGLAMSAACWRSTQSTVKGVKAARKPRMRVQDRHSRPATATRTPPAIHTLFRARRCRWPNPLPRR